MYMYRITVIGLVWLGISCAAAVEPPTAAMVKMDEAKFKDWLSRWDKHIVADARNRYCDKAMGEDIGWLMTPFLDGFYYGYMASKDTKWIDMLIDWTDSWVRRGVKEPDGFWGWPMPKAAGTDVDKLNEWNADSMLGEAMVLRPVALMAGEILKDPTLKEKYAAKAASYIQLAEQIYDKWDKRGGWRETKDGGMISVTLPYGLGAQAGEWAAGFDARNTPEHGFSHPNNKANHVARWLLAMSDATGKAVYKERAAKWFRLMKSRMKMKDGAKDDAKGGAKDGAKDGAMAGGTYQIWNYWQPAGPWDYKPDGSPKHWVGVHPNAGYYSIDAEGIIAAYEHGIVFSKEDIARLIATAIAEKRYWDALAPYSEEIQKRTEAGLKPESWGGLSAVPKYLSLQVRLRDGKPAEGSVR
ncbi:MAG: hypothetical protein NTX50_02185 [Candidatus Sumerlaeota bacterium]|nr:hypothetical protein [Candidatus Sumerlaeota bacterium]